MELWSLMHFLMPHVFQSHREFKEWFSNPMTGMIEGNSEYNDSIIKRLHKVCINRCLFLSFPPITIPIQSAPSICFQLYFYFWLRTFAKVQDNIAKYQLLNTNSNQIVFFFQIFATIRIISTDNIAFILNKIIKIQSLAKILPTKCIKYCVFV